MTPKPDSFWRTTCANSSRWEEFKSLSLVIPISSPCQSWCKRSRDSRSNQVQVIFFFDCVKSWVTETATETDSTTVATSVLARDGCCLGVCSLGYDCCHLHCRNKPWFISVDSSPYSLSLVRPYNVYVVLPCLTTLHLLSKLFFPHSSFAFSVYFPAHYLGLDFISATQSTKPVCLLISHLLSSHTPLPQSPCLPCSSLIFITVTGASRSLSGRLFAALFVSLFMSRASGWRRHTEEVANG